MSDRIIVVGGGGFGREILCWAADCARAGTLAPVGGFIDDHVQVIEGFDVPRLGGLGDYQPQSGDLFLVAIGSPVTKRSIVESLAARSGRFATLIHPTCTVTPTAVIEEGVIMCPYTMAMPAARLERFVTLINFSGIGHDSVCGAFSTLSSMVDVTGNCRIGTEVSIGAGARILPKVTVGDGATVGAGAIVMRSVKPGTTVYAAPAKLLKTKPKAAAAVGD